METIPGLYPSYVGAMATPRNHECITCLNDSSINPLYRSSSISTFVVNLVVDLSLCSIIFLAFLLVRRTRLISPRIFE